MSAEWKSMRDGWYLLTAVTLSFCAAFVYLGHHFNQPMTFIPCIIGLGLAYIEAFIFARDADQEMRRA